MDLRRPKSLACLASLPQLLIYTGKQAMRTMAKAYVPGLLELITTVN